MDSRNQSSQYSGYIGILTSQQQYVVQENIPPESFPYSVNIGGSDIPPFSSQQAQTPSQPDATPVERVVRKKWTPADDEDLISAWLNTSKDAVIGNEQKSGTFWKRVGEYFAAERQVTSGQSDNDVLMVAHEIFYANNGTKFTLEHAWCVLRYEQKWINLNPPKAAVSSKRKTGEDASQPSSTNVGEGEIRPEGIKAAKARRNSSQGKAVENYRNMWELKMEDLSKKEKLSKLAILDTLLTRKEPLSESEEAVKNILLAELF
ncbi:glutathione S-transferase T3-like [Brassica rapa]|uniref:glutathione S-transferase T3-like n=1 Tax=Brassica campestris TaxID=3711 RepID=UPI00142E2CF7|nr:glutathione S-transferase T3-like [Brassica rapa]